MKTVDYLKKHYVIFIPVALIVVLILSYSIYTIQKLYNNYSKTETQELYTYFAGVKAEDKFNIKTNRKNEIIELTSEKNFKLNTIIYNKEKNKAIFPNDMTLVSAKDNYMQYKVNKYASLSFDEANTSYLLKTTDYEKNIDSFFLYDGKDLYFMPESSVLAIDEEKITLSPMSFVIYNNNNSLEYYDNATDEYTVKDIKNEKAKITSNSFTINLSDDKIERANGVILLTKPEYQNLIK